MSSQLPIYQIDAFTDRAFGGNPAAVCPLDVWLSDEVMQAIAMENNLSETAFFVARDDGVMTFAGLHRRLKSISPATRRWPPHG